MTPYASTARMPANADMVEGYRDGLDLSAPEPSANRSRSYRHGFANGRNDRDPQPRGSFEQIEAMADAAMAADAMDAGYKQDDLSPSDSSS